jgi:hypothetical protein
MSRTNERKKTKKNIKKRKKTNKPIQTRKGEGQCLSEGRKSQQKRDVVGR